MRLNIDPRKANQMVRGTVILPHGTGKEKKVLVLCTPEAEAEAKEAGADYVGLDEYIEKIKNGWIDFDVIIAQPAVMGKWFTRTYPRSSRLNAKPQKRDSYRRCG